MSNLELISIILLIVFILYEIRVAMKEGEP
jgi:hypothetical protein